MTYIPKELRRLIFERANGLCEYCLLPERLSIKPHEADHIHAEKHGGKTVEDNLCLSSYYCNPSEGSDIASIDPETGEGVFLFHPRRDNWKDHFRLEGPHIVPLTPKGRVTLFLLNINTPERLQERELLIKMGFYPKSEADLG